MGCTQSQDVVEKPRDVPILPPLPPSPPPVEVNNFGSKYELGKELGRGNYSIVRLATRKADNKKFAVKVVTRDNMTENDDKALRHEVEIMKALDHPNIVKLYDFYEEPRRYYLVIEHMAGGELFDRLLQKEFYTEKEARDLAVTFLRTIKYCHDRNIVHRDVKPENLLLKSLDDDVNVKLADFGFAVRLGGPNYHANAGSPAYVAPEVINRQPIDKPMDMWSCGVILFMLLGGYPPFFEPSQADLFAKIKAGDYEFNPECWSSVSAEAIDLIKKLLTVNRKARPTVDEALVHPWLEKPSEELVTHSLKNNMVLFKTYKYSDLLKKSAFTAASAVIEVIRNPSNARITDVVDLVRKTSNASITNLLIERRKSSSKIIITPKSSPSNTLNGQKSKSAFGQLS
jgi:calcium/calmodulin-dependent protein kinase I